MNCKNKNHSCNSCGEKKCGNKHTTCHNADVVEVVRCKDCIFCKYNSSALTYRCDRRGYYSEEVKESGFCSYGRRTDDEV